MHDKRAFVKERSQTNATLVRLVLQVDAVHVRLQVDVVLEDLLTLAALSLLRPLVLYAHVFVEEALARESRAAMIALELLLGMHTNDVPAHFPRHGVLVQAVPALEVSVAEDLQGLPDLALLLVVSVLAVALPPVGIVELLRVKHTAARLTHHLADDRLVAVVQFLVLVVALARHQHFATDLADRPSRLLVFLLHVAVEEDLSAEHTAAQVTFELFLAVCIAHVSGHLPAQLVAVVAQLTVVQRRLAVTVDVAREVLDSVAHERTVRTRVGGVVASSQLIANTVRLLTLSA